MLPLEKDGLCHNEDCAKAAGLPYNTYGLGSLVSLLLFLCALSSQATIIQPTNRVDWLPGITVGSRVTITNSHLVTITGVDATGTNDCSVAINAAIQAASAGDILFLPAGRYRCNAPIFFNRDYLTFRGEGTNTVLFTTANIYLFVMGGEAALSSGQFVTASVTAGYEKGSTNITLDSVSGITAGDLLYINTLNPSTNKLKIISTLGYSRMLQQTLVVKSVAGSVVGVSPPLVFDFDQTPLVYNIASAAVQATYRGRKQLSVESIKFTFKDPNSTNYGTGVNLFSAQTCFDSQITNCAFEWPYNYAVNIETCAHILFRGNRIQYGQGAGTSHTGIILTSDSGCLIENNIIADTVQGGLMYNSGFTGNAIFGNFWTNTGQTVLMHQVHPMMNLWEANSLDFFEVDGYFGSAGPETLFRNDIHGWEISLALKRYATRIQVVGNVLGYPGAPNVWMSTNSGVGAQEVQVGYPNIGNNVYVGSTLSMKWNDPGGTYVTFTNTGVVMPTNILHGDFSGIPTFAGSTRVGLMFAGDPPFDFDAPAQDYSRWTWTGAGNSSQLTLVEGLYVTGKLNFTTNGPGAYQQLQSGDLATDLFHGNWSYADSEVKWDAAIADHTIPSSLLYTAAPSWWGTNRWPCIGSDLSPKVAKPPAQNRFEGIDDSGTTTTYTLTLTTNGAGTIARSPSASSYADGTVVAVTATANSGNTFTGWGGDIGGSVNPTNITMSASKSITGNFETNTIVRTRIVFH